MNRLGVAAAVALGIFGVTFAQDLQRDPILPSETAAAAAIDEATLRKIAAHTGGRYFHATDAEALAEVVREIDELERTAIVEIRYLEYSERYAAFALSGGASAVLAALLSSTVLRRLP